MKVARGWGARRIGRQVARIVERGQKGLKKCKRPCAPKGKQCEANVHPSLHSQSYIISFGGLGGR